MSESPYRGLTTPAFLVDRQKVQDNCDRMRAKAAISKVAFRPHVKTHKTLEVGRMQHGGEAGPITVSTLAEAEFFAAGGFEDITYAVPIAPEKLGRAAELARKIRTLNLLLDSPAAADAIEQFHRSNGAVFDVFLKIDCGYHRAGVDPDDPASVLLAKRMEESPAMRFHGLLTHAGHSYNVKNAGEVRAIASQETGAVAKFRDRTRNAALIRSIGSTPTTSVVDRFENCDEVRPGNYVFYDAFQSTLGSCAASDVAVSVLATVVGSYPQRGALIVDAGALAMSKDSSPDHIDPQFGYGIVCDASLNPLPLKLRALSQEHGKIAGDPALIATLPIGTHLRIIPNHSCLTAAMYDVFYAIDGVKVVDEWMPVRGW